MHYLYILFSKSSQKFYIGETNNIDERILKHQNHYYSNSFTKIANDWKVVLSFICKDKNEAIYLENFIKKIIGTQIKRILEITTDLKKSLRLLQFYSFSSTT